MQKAQRNFIHKETLSPHLRCPLCIEILDNPTRLGCGHTFCKDCLDEWLDKQNKKSCPHEECKKKIERNRIGKDWIATKIILEQEVCCSVDECNWNGLLEELENHLQQCELYKKQELNRVEMQELQKDINQLLDDKEKNVKSRGIRKLKKTKSLQ